MADKVIKQFNVTKATPAGEQWKNSFGALMQTFFLNLEGVKDKWATVNRRPDSPILSGLTWFEVEEATSKAGKPGMKLKVAQAPEGEAAKAADLSSAGPSSSIRWGEAVMAASMQVKDGDVQKVLSYAKDLYLAEAPDVQLHAKAAEAEKEAFKSHVDPKSGDTVLDEIPDGPVDVDELPF